MAVDMNAALARKYNILEEHATAAQQQAQAALLGEQARAPLYGAEAQQAAAQAGLIKQQTSLAPMEAQARAGYYGALGQQAAAQSGLTGQQTEEAKADLAPADAGIINQLKGAISNYGRTFGPQNLGFPGLPTPMQSAPNNGVTLPTMKSVLDKNPDGTPKYARGTSKVPGKGKPNKDTVDAKLAPGEAVLNQGAAEHMGRGLIDVMNAIGAHKMALEGNAPPQKGGMPVLKKKAAS